MYYCYNESYRYQFQGGDAIYEDVNHDGQIDRYDMVYLGNSNPKCIVRNVISYNNWGYNITLYGKGNGEREFVLENVISLKGGGGDNITEQMSLLKDNTYLWNGEKSLNKEGEEIDDVVFVSTEFKGFSFTDDGIDLNGFLSLKDDFDF